MNPTTFKNNGSQMTVYLDAPRWHRDGPTAAVGRFVCKSKDCGADVLAQSLDFIRENGIQDVIGPMDGDTWHPYRFVTETDDSPTFMMEPKHDPLAADVLITAGFAPISSYFSARVALSETATAAPEDDTGLQITPWDGADPEALFQQVYGLSIAAFEKNAYYKPVSLDAFLQMYMPIVPVMKKELIFFARDAQGRLAGFLFGMPNYNEGPTPQAVILKTYASLQKGAGQLLAHAFHTAARDMGYQTAIHALIHDDNLSALRSQAEGAEIFRRYALYGLRLDG